MDALNPWRIRVMAALRQYGDELGERATRMAMDAPLGVTATVDADALALTIDERS
jgi:hypothetical protein